MAEALNLKAKNVKDAFKPYEHFARVTLDAYALVDQDGRVVKANQLFSQLVGEKSKQILKANSLDELLRFDINDKPLKVADLLEYTTPTRIDEVRGRAHYAENLNLIIGVYPFMDDETNSHLGTFILIRDVTAEKNLHDKYKTTKIETITDPLTGLYSRSYFEGYLAKQKSHFENNRDESPSLSIIMVDIDFFKKVNDAYGHQAGDHVLKTMGRLLKQAFRKTDYPCRYGGEEFIIILPNTPLGGAAKAANNLRQMVEAEQVIFEGERIPITISCGVSQFLPKQEDYKASIARADAALYTSKDRGRNQVHVHTGKEIIGSSVS